MGHADAITVRFLEAPDTVTQGIQVLFDLQGAAVVNAVARSTQESASLQFDVPGVTLTTTTRSRVAALIEPGSSPTAPVLSDILEIVLSPTTINLVDVVAAAHVSIEFSSDPEQTISGTIPLILVVENGQEQTLFSTAAIAGLPAGSRSRSW